MTPDQESARIAEYVKRIRKATKPIEKYQDEGTFITMALLTCLSETAASALEFPWSDDKEKWTEKTKELYAATRQFVISWCLEEGAK